MLIIQSDRILAEISKGKKVPHIECRGLNNNCTFFHSSDVTALKIVHKFRLSNGFLAFMSKVPDFLLNVKIILITRQRQELVVCAELSHVEKINDSNMILRRNKN